MKPGCAVLIGAVGAAGVVAVGLSASGARADEPGLVGGDELFAARLAGYVYVNVASGEVRRTEGPRQASCDLYWQNDDTAGSCHFFYGQDYPTRDTVATGRVKFGSAVVHWGDVYAESNTAYEVAYASNIGCDAAGTGVVGFKMVNVFIDDYDGGIDPGGSGSTGVVGFILGDIAGGDCTLGTTLFQGWMYTVDLEGSGYEFNWGVTDLDGDGLHDFGYSYEFVQGQAGGKGICGPLLVRPSSLGGAGIAPGCPDAHDWFNQRAGSASFSDYAGAFWFGGGDCAAGRPYSSFLLNLYGDGGRSFCDIIDYNCDGIIDFDDYLEFLNRFDGSDVSADLNEDGLVDFGDYLEFLNLFDACS